MFLRIVCLVWGHVWSDGRRAGHCEQEYTCLRCGGVYGSFQEFFWRKS